MTDRRKGAWAATARIVVLSALAAAGCRRPPAPIAPAPDAAPDLGPPAAPRDAGPDSADAAADAGPPDAGPRATGHRHAAAGEGGGRGISGLAVSDGAARAAVARTLAAHAGALRGCYESARAKVPALAGRVRFRLTLDQRGRVTLGEVVTSTLGDGDPEMCMVNVLRDIRFPTAGGAAESTVAFQMGFGR
jgi:hypothetical protein